MSGCVGGLWMRKGRRGGGVGGERGAGGGERRERGGSRGEWSEK